MRSRFAVRAGRLTVVANDEESFEILVDNGHSLADVAADGRTLRVYMRAPGVDNWLGFVDMTGSSPVPYYYVTDHLGSVLAVVDANGNVVERYEYDAWGKVLSVTDAEGQALARSAIGNRILWQAREYSWTTGLYYFRNRWYDPTIGRWISKDPIGINGGINLYEFCEGNPVGFVYPLGFACKEKEWVEVGSNKPEFHSWNCSEWKEYGGEDAYGNRDMYIKHFRDVTFATEPWNIPSSAANLLAYGIVTNLQMNNKSYYCLVLEPMTLWKKENGSKTEYKVKYHVKVFDRHPVDKNKPEIKQRKFVGKDFEAPATYHKGGRR